jgi:hypothetical protein
MATGTEKVLELEQLKQELSVRQVEARSAREALTRAEEALTVCNLRIVTMLHAMTLEEGVSDDEAGLRPALLEAFRAVKALGGTATLQQVAAALNKPKSKVSGSLSSVFKLGKLRRLRNGLYTTSLFEAPKWPC